MHCQKAAYKAGTGTNLNNGILSIDLVKKLLESLKLRRIEIGEGSAVLSIKQTSTQPSEAGDRPAPIAFPCQP